MTADRILETVARYTLRAAAVLWVALFAWCVYILIALCAAGE
jgi:hypothetical protein